MPGAEVVTSPKEIRSLSRSSLKGFWVQVLICYFIFFAITQYIPGFIGRLLPKLSYVYEFEYMGVKQALQISFVPYIVMAFLNGPFRYGIAKLHLRQIRERGPVAVEETFSGFKQFGKNFGAYIRIWITILIAGLPFAALATLIMFLFSKVGGSFLQALGALLYILAGMASIIAMIYFAVLLSMTFYILVENRDIKIIDAAKISAELMKKNVGRFIILRISFLGWIFIAALLSNSLLSLLFTVLPNTGPVAYLANVITNLPILLATIYMDRGQAFFYEFVTGHLRKSVPQPVNTTAWT